MVLNFCRSVYINIKYRYVFCYFLPEQKHFFLSIRTQYVTTSKDFLLIIIRPIRVFQPFETVQESILIYSCHQIKFRVLDIDITNGMLKYVTIKLLS